MDLELDCEIPPDLAGQRLDQALAVLFPDYSRSRLTQWIRAGQVEIDGRHPRPRDPVRGGEQVAIRARLVNQEQPRAQDIPIDVIYQDADILVVNKPPGLVVHPAAGNYDGTLVNALVYRDPQALQLPRAGIVHRLDKDTSGLMVVARSLVAHKHLVDQIQAREVSREYLAVVHGVMTAGGRVEAPIGRHPTQRTRMAVVQSGRYAATEYRVVERFRAHTLVRLKLETGRTHQIRVHMAHIRYPLVGDPVYSGRARVPAGAGEALREVLGGFRRQALHAVRLGLVHPVSGEAMDWEAPLPDDLQHLLDALRRDGEQEP